MNNALIVGFGDIAERALPELAAHFRVCALIRPERIAQARKWPTLQCLPGDLDHPATLAGIGCSISHIVHLAPPPPAGAADPRTEHLLGALTARSQTLQRLVYVSTSGVYGDCAGDWVDEQRPVNPMSDRARRRVDAERRIDAFGRAHGVATVVLRVPGIYARDRLPLARLRKATPVLQAADDVYTNHIHADDLASIVVSALMRADAVGIYNVCDDSALKMGDWFDLIADRAGLPRPPRIARAAAQESIPPALLSFMSESRRLRNERMKRELRVRLRYPTVFDGVPVRL